MKQKMITALERKLKRTPFAALSQSAMPSRQSEIRNTTENYRVLLNSMSEGAVMLTPDGIIHYANLAFAKMMEVSSDEITGKTFFEFLSFGWNQPFFEFLHGSDEKPRTLEVSFASKSGKEIFALLARNSILFENTKWISLKVTDLTTREVTEETLRRTQQRLNTVAELTSDAVWEIDASTKEIWTSEGFANLLGYPFDSIKPTMFWWKQNIHPDDRAVIVSEVERLIERGEGDFEKSYRLKRFDGTYAEVVDHAIAIRDKETKTFRVIGSIVDVTDKNKAETAKKEISKRISDAQEQERKRVARDLHDGVSQLLAASTFRLHTVHNQMLKENPSLAQNVLEAQVLLEKAHQEVQLISRNLRPSELDDLGLSAALRQLCTDFKKRANLIITLDMELSRRSLGPNVDLTIYRIIQEALNNVEKHAAAKNVHVSISRNRCEFIVKVRDDGKGFDVAKLAEKTNKGCGLENIRERASFLNGSVTWISNASHGTTLTLVLPVI